MEDRINQLKLKYGIIGALLLLVWLCASTFLRKDYGKDAENLSKFFHNIKNLICWYSNYCSYASVQRVVSLQTTCVHKNH